MSKINPNWPANPCLMRQIDDNKYRVSKPGDPSEHIHPNGGMSIRTELAARAMEGLISGMLSHPKFKPTHSEKHGMEKDIAKAAVSMADALIVELNKPTEQ